MALQKTITITGQASVAYGGNTLQIGEQQATIVAAYIKVENITGNKETVDFIVSISGEENAFSREFSFSPSMEGSNFIKQAYEHLKTLPEFADAEDV